MYQGWQVTYSPEWDGWLVKINGKAVCDESGAPAVYRPPQTISSEREYDQWRKQIAQSIARMSGVPCNIDSTS